MTDYILKISSYGGLVAGATHFRGRVEGPFQESCHGGRRFNGWDGPLAGKTTCSEGHVIPDRRNWDVSAEWTEERFKRYSAKHFEGDGPDQFLDKQVLIETAVKRFTGELPRRWWEDEPEVGKPGDRLFIGFVPMDDEDLDEEWGKLNGTVPYGSVLARIPETSAEKAAEGEGCSRCQAKKAPYEARSVCFDCDHGTMLCPACMVVHCQEQLAAEVAREPRPPATFHYPSFESEKLQLALDMIKKETRP